MDTWNYLSFLSYFPAWQNILSAVAVIVISAASFLGAEFSSGYSYGWASAKRPWKWYQHIWAYLFPAVFMIWMIVKERREYKKLVLGMSLVDVLKPTNVESFGYALGLKNYYHKTFRRVLCSKEA
jgi:hypothetical protein